MALKLRLPALKGTQRLQIGNAVYGLPEGSRVVTVEDDKLA